MRRQIITHPKFQYHYIFSYIVGVLVSFLGISFFTVGTLFFLSKNPYFSEAQTAILRNHAAHLALSIFLIFVPCFFLMLAFDLYRSMSLIGPLRRIETWLETILLGQNPSYLNIRPRDDLRTTLEILQAIRDKQAMGRKK